MPASEQPGELSAEEGARLEELLELLRDNVVSFDVMRSSYRLTFPAKLGRALQEFAGLERRAHPFLGISTSRSATSVTLTIRAHESMQDFVRDRWRAEAVVMRLVRLVRAGFF